MAIPRVLAQSKEGTRITRLGKGLILVSVPVESPLDEKSARLLSKAEKAVIELVLRGLSNAAIARERGASPRTVANQLASAYKKLRVGSRRELVARFGK
jgi:DNA-binding CsgD family transcriptional regulator